MNSALALPIVLVTQCAFTVPIDSILAKDAAPNTPRGGVLMVPLLSQQPGDNWPETLDVTLEDGQVIQGHVGWIEQNPWSTYYWAENALIFRNISQADDSSTIHPKDTTTGPILLAQLPKNEDGRIAFGGDIVDPIWFDLPQSLPNLNIAPIDTTATLTPNGGLAIPKTSALDFWRITLIASRKGVLPPPYHYGEAKSLAAQRGAQLWRIAMSRLATSSRGAAAECRDLLTNTANDGENTFACWSTHSEAQLLGILLDKNATSRQLALRALRWCEEQQPYIFWLEKVYGDEISIAIANPTLEVILAAVKWREGNDIPLAVEIPPNETVRIPIKRIDTLDQSIFGPTTVESSIEWLVLQIDTKMFSIPVVPSKVVALPPSVQLHSLYPPWNLKSMQMQTPTTVALNLETKVQLRKMFGKWEFFIQCSGNQPSSQGGGEQVVLFNPVVKKTITVGPSNHSSTPDGWTATVYVPEDWIADETLLFSIVRKHALPSLRESGPIPTVPWRSTYPAPIVVDLSQWDTIDQFPD